jgi:type VI protein secretion system component VasK
LIVFFLLLLARNEWWDRWPWPRTLITIFVLNLMLAAASVVLLQNAARKAKNEAEATLEAKVKRLQAATAESQAQSNANQAEKLLEEIRSLRRGAFVSFWENPVLGAILLPSGGMAVLQMLIWFMGP